MPDDERDDQPGPGREGFVADLLREATITGTGDDADTPPEEPQGTNPGTTEKQHDDDSEGT